MAPKILSKVRRRSFAVATLVSTLLLLAIVIVLLQYIQERRHSQTEKLDALVNGELMAFRSSIEASLYQRLSLPIALKAFVLTNPNFTSKDFSTFADNLKASVPGVMSLQLAPNAVVTFVTSIERNRKALGHDLLADEARRPAVERSIQNRQFIVAGPIKLIQGGRAIIARLPIFIDGYQSQTEFAEFWGFATILIDVDTLFEGAGIRHIDPRVEIAIRGVDGLGGNGAMIYGDSSLFDVSTRTPEVALPNGSWQQATVFRGNPEPIVGPFFFLGAIFLTMFAVLSTWALIYRQGSKELLRAKEEAETASKLKSDFIAVMSHEIRTPLNGVLGALDLLGHEKLKPKQAEYVRSATASGEHLLAQINDVLDMSRIESGALKVQQVPLEIEAILEEVVAINRNLAKAKNTVIKYRLGLSQRQLAGDPLLIRQVLINLVGNAVKFTRDGCVEVAVNLVNQNQDGAVVEFRVTDTGIGIAVEDQSRIFDEFVTLDTDYNRETDGSGLGLAIAQRVVTAMKGEMGVDSQEGQGASFWFHLPQVWADSLPGGKGAQFSFSAPRPHLSADHQSSNSLKILTVEDNDTNRLVVGDLLRLAGHTVVEASDGREGIEIASTQAFDLILMDISMPRMDGIEATRQIRDSNGPNMDTKIIGLTAHAMNEQHNRYLESGFDDCITKPFRLNALYDALGFDKEAQTAASNNPSSKIIDDNIWDQFAQSLPNERMQQTALEICEEINTELPIILSSKADIFAVGDRAHRLAGSAAIVGATALAELLREVEAAAKAKKIAKLEAVKIKLPKSAKLTTACLLQRVRATENYREL